MIEQTSDFRLASEMPNQPGVRQVKSGTATLVNLLAKTLRWRAG